MKRTSVIWQLDKANLEGIVKDNSTISGILSYFGLKNIGGNYLTLKKRLSEDGIDYSHIALGKNSNKGKKLKSKLVPLDQVLTENSSYRRGSLKKRLVKEGYLEYKCSICSLTDWNNKPISLELDHINGVNDDNRLDNLRFICPNCHSQTPTHAGKNVKNKKVKLISCQDCGEPKTNNSSLNCSICAKKKNRKVVRPSKDELNKLLWEKPTIHIAKQFGVTDNAIAKWAKSYDLEKPSPGYWTKLKFIPGSPNGMAADFESVELISL